MSGPKIPIKMPLKTHDLQNKYLRWKYNKIFEILEEVMSQTKFGPPYYRETRGDEIILEEIGTTLQQLAWIDRTGWFVTWRLSPLYREIPSIIEAGNKFAEKLKNHFASIDHFEVIENEKRTFYVITGTNSIGD